MYGGGYGGNPYGKQGDYSVLPPTSYTDKVPPGWNGPGTDPSYEKYKALIQELCKFRPANEYFRLSAESNCRDVVRCVPNDFIGGHTLAAVRCPTGLLFDLDGQVGKMFL